ncbi:MAG TPA: hypothetical protein VHM90_08915 [Phycisphaerae bacterium]|nr:hypothetical protein [Phycisphaerae bacterium]
MAKDAATTKLISELTAQKKSVDGAVTDIAADLKTVKDAVGSKSASAAAIEKACEDAKKNLTGYDKIITDGTKKQGEGDKSKDADAKKLATDLKGSLAKASSTLKDLRGNIDMAGKIATKGSAEDAALNTSLTKVLESGNEISKDLGSLVISLPDEIKNVDEQFNKLAPNKAAQAHMMKTLVPALSKRMAEVGPKITTATSISSSLASEAKKGATAYEAAVKEKVQKANDLKNKLDGQIAAVKTAHANGLKQVTKYTPFTK